MDVEALRWFQQVADGATVTEVAEVYLVSQPGVSRALARLESEVGTPLLHRTGRVLRPTHAGAVFKRHVDNLLHERNAIANPLLLHIAGADHFVGPDVQRAMHDALDDHPKVTLYDYPGEDHGFAAEMGKRRSEEAAKLADQRTEEFFAQHLG